MRWLFLLPTTLLGFCLGVNADPSAGALYPPGLQPLIARANALLSAGQFNDAIKAYSDAIDQSPADYVLYYKRATAYSAMNRHSSALADYDQVLSMTSDTFDKAYLMKARIHAKDGHFSAAKEAIKKYNSRVKNDSSIQEVLLNVSEGELAAKKAKQAMKAKLWQACVEAASTALGAASHSTDLRQLRADCAIASGDIEGAVGDLTRLTHLTQPSTDLLMRIFRLSYFLFPYTSSSSPAMSTLKQCIHFDPDSKQCLPAHRLVKSFDRTFKKLDTAVSEEKWKAVIDLLIGSDPASGFAAKFDEALATHTTPDALFLPSNIPIASPKKTSPRREVIVRSLCKAYVNSKSAEKGLQWCNELLAMEGHENDPDGLVGRGEAALKKEEWDEAVRIFEKAFEASGRSNRDIHGRLQRAQKLLKQSKQKDYYKVLDISRDADQKTIKKAFRRAAMKAHPDKGGSEAKMAAVNEAYEVLKDPELKSRFDNGDDPNDPMAQQGFHAGGSGHPFAQFFQQQSGGGGNFFQGGFPGGGGYQFHFSHGH
ncbi:hypothetical protein EIP91_001661 [Steccherinum ochraceum]|uniref:J domain-containing protein n=1 Tax=Steccherinum ochraceum TaxID=92696 RepID=A0A4R0RU96_9APHY|nr:hypothetical protein EIP91_001661 [Steccherinum ochraceum]